MVNKDGLISPSWSFSSKEKIVNSEMRFVTDTKTGVGMQKRTEENVSSDADHQHTVEKDPPFLVEIETLTLNLFVCFI